MKTICAILVIFFGCCLPVPECLAQATLASNKYAVAGIKDSSKPERFLRHLQEVVRQGKRREVAALIDFPITVRIAGGPTQLRRKSDLLKHYDAIFNSRVRGKLKTQRASNLFVNWRGVMIGNGEIWFNQMPGGDKAPLKITAVNN